MPSQLFTYKKEGAGCRPPRRHSPPWRTERRRLVVLVVIMKNAVRYVGHVLVR